MPFEECTPALSIEHAEAIAQRITCREGGVSEVVPEGFERYVRVHHALDGGTWAELAPNYLTRAAESYDHPFPDPVVMAEGNLGASAVDLLVDHLVGWSGDDAATHYGLWVGWGDLNGSSTGDYFPVDTGWQRLRWAMHRLRQRWMSTPDPEPVDPLADCPTIEWWGGRDMWLFDGGISAVRTIGSVWPHDDVLWRRSPQWWWPEDQRWFVGNEIDWPWSYLAGPGSLVERVLADPALETVEVDYDDPW